jgi:asparagine synthase (glutamine-hydrolysing)
MALGLETRVPFLDKDFLDVAMREKPEEKQPKSIITKKYILRKAFDTLRILIFRRSFVETKEQFSDGVGYSWIDQLAYCSTQVTDSQLAAASVEFPYNPPTTKKRIYIEPFFINTIRKLAPNS